MTLTSRVDVTHFLWYCITFLMYHDRGTEDLYRIRLLPYRCHWTQFASTSARLLSLPEANCRPYSSTVRTAQPPSHRLLDGIHTKQNGSIIRPHSLEPCRRDLPEVYKASTTFSLSTVATTSVTPTLKNHMNRLSCP